MSLHYPKCFQQCFKPREISQSIQGNQTSPSALPAITSIAKQHMMKEKHTASHLAHRLFFSSHWLYWSIVMGHDFHCCLLCNVHKTSRHHLISKHDSHMSRIRSIFIGDSNEDNQLPWSHTASRLSQSSIAYSMFKEDFLVSGETQIFLYTI